MEFVDFEIEDHSSCAYDYVEGKAGNVINVMTVCLSVLDSDERQMIKKCGSTKPDKIVSSSNSLKVKFHSDSSVVMKGFRATWKQVTASSGGNIKTPGYPNSYPTNQDKVGMAPTSPSLLPYTGIVRPGHWRFPQDRRSC